MHGMVNWKIPTSRCPILRGASAVQTRRNIARRSENHGDKDDHARSALAVQSAESSSRQLELQRRHRLEPQAAIRVSLPAACHGAAGEKRWDRPLDPYATDRSH